MNDVKNQPKLKPKIFVNYSSALNHFSVEVFFFFCVCHISNIYEIYNTTLTFTQNSTNLISTIDSIATTQLTNHPSSAHNRMRMQLLINNFLHHKYFQTITKFVDKLSRNGVIYPLWAIYMPFMAKMLPSHSYFSISIVTQSVNHFTSVTKMHVISWNTRLRLKATRKNPHTEIKQNNKKYQKSFWIKTRYIFLTPLAEPLTKICYVRHETASIQLAMISVGPYAFRSLYFSAAWCS